MKKKTLYLSMCGLAAVLLLVAASIGSDSTKADKEETVKHDYIGAKKCRICHKDVHASWKETSHAKAWSLLKPEEQKKTECVACHSTGTTAKGVLLEGVQCEACHGAGSDYRKKSIMEDRGLSIKNGLVIPDSTVCVGCHNDKSPTFKGFDYAKYRANEKGIHVMLEQTKEADRDQE
ncbi:MAG: cytochrome c3 family protein [Candidatus Zixiibacteriota bacterium]|nr:MAG: cytochrome c3 family protein [candidate division Zixibacteria bacterium]